MLNKIFVNVKAEKLIIMKKSLENGIENATIWVFHEINLSKQSDHEQLKIFVNTFNLCKYCACNNAKDNCTLIA